LNGATSHITIPADASSSVPFAISSFVDDVQRFAAARGIKQRPLRSCGQLAATRHISAVVCDANTGILYSPPT